MKLDLSTPLLDPKGEPFTIIGITGQSLFFRLRRFEGEGKSLKDALDTVAKEVGGKDLLRPMDLGDMLYNAVEQSPLYVKGDPIMKRRRARLLGKLVAKTFVELDEEELRLLKEDYEQPDTYNGAQLLALEDVLDKAKAREVEAKEKAAEGAKLVAVEDASG